MEPPPHCPGCDRPYGPNATLVKFMHCPCPGAEYGGHTTWQCRYCGWIAAPGHNPPAWAATISDPLRLHD